MKMYATVFGDPIAHSSDDHLLYFIAHRCPMDYLSLRTPSEWFDAWFACIEEARFRSLIPLDGWSAWSKCAGEIA